MREVLNHAGWTWPLRLVACTEEVMSNRETRAAAGFEIAMPDQVEGYDGEMRFAPVGADATTLALLRSTMVVVEVTEI